MIICVSPSLNEISDVRVLVDSSDMGIDEVVEAIKTVINKAK